MKLVIANWKMNMNLPETTGWLEEFTRMQKNDSLAVEVVIAPPFPYLGEVKSTGLSVGAQDVSALEKGAHTGEVGAFQIKDYCKYCIVGHSERKEDKAAVLKKRNACLKARIIPIVCFVDPADALDYYADGAVLAWEDPANISVGGNYKAKDPQEIDAEATFMKKSLPDNATLVYGGSVNRQNAKELANIVELDGVLVGNASLDPAHFMEIVEAFTL